MCSTSPAAMARRRLARIICRMRIPGNVNYPRKRVIVSSIIVVTFISILRSHDRPMTSEGEGRPEPPEDRGNRNVENAVMLGFFAVLVAAGIWLLGTMADLRKVQDCTPQGRPNSPVIDLPHRTL